MVRKPLLVLAAALAAGLLLAGGGARPAVAGAPDAPPASRHLAPLLSALHAETGSGVMDSTWGSAVVRAALVPLR